MAYLAGFPMDFTTEFTEIKEILLSFLVIAHILRTGRIL